MMIGVWVLNEDAEEGMRASEARTAERSRQCEEHEEELGARRRVTSARGEVRSEGWGASAGEG